MAELAKYIKILFEPKGTMQFDFYLIFFLTLPGPLFFLPLPFSHLWKEVGLSNASDLSSASKPVLQWEKIFVARLCENLAWHNLYTGFIRLSIQKKIKEMTAVSLFPVTIK